MMCIPDFYFISGLPARVTIFGELKLVKPVQSKLVGSPATCMFLCAAVHDRHLVRWRRLQRYPSDFYQSVTIRRLCSVSVRSVVKNTTLYY